MMKSAAAITTLLSVAIPFAGAVAETLAPAWVFEGNTTAPTNNGTMQAVHVTVQSWAIASQTGQNRPPHELPVRGFYVAHLLSGDISTTIAGQTTEHLPGDYWTVKSGATMEVKVLGEYAVLETTVVSKQ